MNGIQAFLEVLVAGETRYLFGNPGSTELPLSDALATDPRLEYILSLHELPLLAIADGYAMASGRLGVACVHISGGLGNAMGMLFNAYLESTPLLIMAGQQDGHAHPRPPRATLGRGAGPSRCAPGAAHAPAILAGSRVTEADGVAELTHLARGWARLYSPRCRRRTAGCPSRPITRSTPVSCRSGRRTSGIGWPSSTSSWWSGWAYCGSWSIAGTTAPSLTTPG